METPTPTTPTPGIGVLVSSPRTPTNTCISNSIPNAPRKTVSTLSRCGISQQVPEGYTHHPILQKRGLPPIRKIVF